MFYLSHWNWSFLRPKFCEKGSPLDRKLEAGNCLFTSPLLFLNTLFPTFGRTNPPGLGIIGNGCAWRECLSNILHWSLPAFRPVGWPLDGFMGLVARLFVLSNPEFSPEFNWRFVIHGFALFENFGSWNWRISISKTWQMSRWNLLTWAF